MLEKLARIECTGRGAVQLYEGYVDREL